MTWVARCCRQVVAAALDPTDLFEDRQHLVHAYSASAAEIENLAYDVGCGSLDSTLHGIRNVCEVAGLLTVTEHLDVVSRGKRLHESRDGHVGSLAGSVNSEV